MTMRKFPPLAPDHIAVGMPCGICERRIEAGDETTLVPKKSPPRDGRVHTVEAALCHWVCAQDELRHAENGLPLWAKAWLPPADAVEPINHFHTLYMRLAEMNQGLLREAAKSPDVLQSPAFGDLLGSCAELSNTAARMTALLEGIRRDFPKVWDVWCNAAAGEMAGLGAIECAKP